MNLLTVSPRLIMELFKHPYPLTEYNTLAVSHPYSAVEIREIHQAMQPWLPERGEAITNI